MPHDSARGTATERFDRTGVEATESLRGDSRRLHALAEQYREQHRGDLEEWMQLRARLDRRGGSLRPVGTDALRAEYEARGRDLAALQARLKRLDVVARQLDILWAYLDSPETVGEEPGPMADDSPATMSLRIVQAQEGQRQRMAEDIHDGPAQALTNAIFQVEYLDRILGDADRAAQAEVAFLHDMLRNGLDEVRTFITALRPTVVDAGAALVCPAHSAGGITNVRKHAAASKVVIGLEGDALVIEDNRRDFDLMRLASGNRNFGLQSCGSAPSCSAASSDRVTTGRRHPNPAPAAGAGSHRTLRR